MHVIHVCFTGLNTTITEGLSKVFLVLVQDRLAAAVLQMTREREMLL